MRRVSKYRKLQIHMMLEGYEYKDLAKCLGRSNSYVGCRLRMDRDLIFSVEEAYKILDLLNIPKEKIFEYFPPNGEEIRPAV